MHKLNLFWIDEGVRWTLEHELDFVVIRSGIASTVIKPKSSLYLLIENTAGHWDDGDVSGGTFEIKEADGFAYIVLQKE